MANDLQSAGAYLAILRRRKLHFLVPATLIFVAAAVLAFTLPPVYRSTVTLLIEKQEIPTDMVATTVTAYAAEQIQTISQQVMTYDTLLLLAQDFDLYPDERAAGLDDEVVGKIHDSITLEQVSEDIVDPRTGRARTVTVAFSVSFDDEVPAVARKVAEKLGELFLAKSLETRAEQAAGASTFIDAEASRLNARIVELEAALATLKRENPSLLPKFSEMNRTFLENAEQEKKQLMSSIALLESRKVFLEAGLAQMDDQSLEQLTQLRTELAEAQNKYSNIHPDVARLKRAIAALEAERKSAPKTGPAAATTQNYPAYIALRNELQTVVANLSSERSKLAQTTRDIADYQVRLTRAPDVEKDYLALMRDYQNTVNKYDEIQGKQMQAHLAEVLERTQKGEGFSLLERARLPKDPIRPNRLGILLLGIMIASMSGTGVAAISEVRDERIHGITELVSVLKTQPIGIIPVIEGPNGARS